MKTQLFVIMSATPAENSGSTILGIVVILFIVIAVFFFIKRVKESQFNEERSIIDLFLSKISIFDTVSNKEINDFTVFASSISLEVFESIKALEPPYLDLLNQIISIIEKRGDVSIGTTTMDGTGTGIDLLESVDRNKKIDKTEKEIKKLIQRMVIDGFFKKLIDFDSPVPHIYLFAEIIAASEIDVLLSLSHPDAKIQEILDQILLIIQERGDVTSDLPMNDESQLAQRNELINITTKKIEKAIGKVMYPC